MKIIACFAALLLALASSVRAAETACDDLAKLSLPQTEITAATLIAKGEFTPPPGAIASCNPTLDCESGPSALYAAMPSFCRVQATLRPTADSNIRIEVWLPTAGWNGRLQAVGNSGLLPNIFYGSLALALRSGFAASATNTGLEDSAGEKAGDGRAISILGHPERLVDWSYRAVHEMTVTAKAIVAARYGTPAKYAYWNSCGTGGRQGLVEAERYPDDFDGIAVGAAANPMTRLQAATLYGAMALSKNEASFLSRGKWAAYSAAALASCDADDGVKDGLLSDPLGCKFDPRTIQCTRGDREDCLTAPQIAALNKVRAGMKNPRTGAQLYPGYPVGTSLELSQTLREAESSAVETFRALFQKADWDYHSMDFDKDIGRSDTLGNALMNAADETRLTALFARGGKILMFHGWNDGAITPLSSIEYYSRAVAANGGREKTSNSIRLFMVPGMEHCGGGDGPHLLHRMGVLMNWVEKGKAPDSIVVSHATGDVVDRTRPLCPYPEVAAYRGAGSIDEAASFQCGALQRK